MDRRCFRKIIFILGLSVVFPSFAYCPLAEKYHQEGKSQQEVVALNVCATSYNDDESQMKLAESYLNGARNLRKDEKMALYMYQLAAENGNAEAQVRLAEMLQTFDTSAERRAELKTYLGKIQKINDDPSAFSGEILHPYTLLLLASERPENKWYYPSLKRAAPAKTSILLQNYKITPEKRQAALKDASKWKTRKLLETAKEILYSDEYSEFEKRLKNNSTRTKAMSELKDRLTGYVDAKQKERALPL